MTEYLIDVNLGSTDKMTEITKFISFTRKNRDKFVLVFGGTKYKSELKKVHNLHRYVFELKKLNQAYEVNVIDVDSGEDYFKQFQTCIHDDPHIYSIVNKSNCKIIATQDQGISDFFSTYPKSIWGRRPEFYYKSDSVYDSFFRKYK